MTEYALHAGAIRDLTEIYDYIAQDSPAAADRMLSEFNQTFETLAEFPLTGRALGRRLRVKVLRDYLILYSAKSIPLRIVVVAHGSRHPLALLQLAQERR